MAMKFPFKMVMVASMTMATTVLCTAPSFALDFSHTKAPEEIYDYEQYLSNGEAPKSQDLYSDGHRPYRMHNGGAHHGQWQGQDQWQGQGQGLGRGPGQGQGQGYDNFDYGRDRYYGQERPYPNRPICPYNDGQGHHKPHPNCPEFAHGGEYPSYGPHYPGQGHYPRPPRPPRPPQGEPPFYDPPPVVDPNLSRSIRACVAYELDNGTYSKDFPITVDLLDGLVLANQYQLYLDNSMNDLFVVFNTRGSRYPTILPLGNRKNLSNAATVLTDLHGKNWRISRTWKRCSM